MVTSRKQQQKKAFVLDTNVLLHDPHAMYSFDGALVGIPSVALEELDQFKREGTDRGRNTREVVRVLDQLREKGSLHEGVPLDNGAVVRILFLSNKPPQLPFQLTVVDNQILLCALELQHQGYTVRFISKDLNARVKADALGIEPQDYLKETVSQDQFYRGWRQIDVPAVQLKKEYPSVLDELANDDEPEMNEFVLVASQHNPHNNRLFRYVGEGSFKSVADPRFQWPLGARNPQQKMAIDLLFDPEVQFVTLFGPAGTGKTFLALLVGLHKVLIEAEFQKLLISRPVIPLGRDIGYLPGDVKEKIHQWMLPIYDNMEFIIHSATGTDKPGQHEENGHEQHHHEERMRGRRGKYHRRHHQPRKGNLLTLDELVYRGKVSMEAITYMRGRSIPYQFILIDESQNLTPHEVKTIVSRVGEGSKIVLVGDPYQIDSPYLDFGSNGLVTSSEKFKGQRIFGTVYLPTSERSELSMLATELL